MTKLRVRARAVDMLGRQQIAGIPTAIHELFKNAHDAYAERVEVDYFRKSRVLVLRDDGYGMTRHDVESRWLTLGTESRVNANKILDENEWRGPKNLPKRSIMGEKGIGRLAIAVIAPITLLMTRASRPDGTHDLVVALVHWGLFEQPGLDISQIDVAIQEFSGGAIPSKDDISSLADRVSSNLTSLKSEIAPDSFKRLNEELEQVRLIGPDNLDKALNSNIENSLSLKDGGCGTHFILLPVAPELDDDIDSGSDKESSKLERNLLGFSNGMSGITPIIKTEFRDHALNEVTPRIGQSSFFSNSDFSKTDQYFEGEFDEFGQFVGTVTIYGKSRPFVCNWAEGKGRTPRCGPFSFRYGYVQGRASETSLSPEDWTQMTGKTEKIGGLYIYRDEIRVLPYGNSDVDWLDIEKRRTYAAKDWFFSYRRGFGYVAISHVENGSLTEKAGREGFRENLAYRDFRSILVNFFKQLAYEFFRQTSPQGEDYWEGKVHFSTQAALLKKQQEKAAGRRKELQDSFKEFFTLYNQGAFEAQSEEILAYLEDRIEFFCMQLDLGDFASKIRLLELDIKQRIKSLSKTLNLTLPRGLALTNNLKKDWASYEVISGQVKERIIAPLRLKSDEVFREAISGRVADSERRLFALQDIQRERDDVVRNLAIRRRETAEAAELMQMAMKDVLQEEFSQLRVNIEELVEEFTRRSAENPEDLDRVQHEAESGIEIIRAREHELLDSFKRQMIELTEGVRNRETLDDRFAALETRNQVLEEQIEFYSDFAQMGMSVGILQHEFEGASQGIRSSMSELKPWADKNPKLNNIYQKLRTHIDHLEGYLKVLDPLGRRMHRPTIDVSGGEILDVIRGVFKDRLESSEIHLEATLGFRSQTIRCKSSAVLGAFINVIDNAIFWLNSRAVDDKRITLDSDGSGFLISNTGPGIEERIKDRIFDFGETRKPGGRGMGLSIARQTLRREGLDIDLSVSGADASPQFRIYSKEDQEKSS
ncbi:MULTISPECIES: ATP-binding protein [Pseudomonas]|uniref:Histidine kinase domain-containing protein n=1 Tax=Pseudomonas fulva TaxID=47880 RepID=A0A0D0IYZ5_9PSED|nr:MULTISPECIES: ATP-binding protein [Pseudomonas]KIP98425.1 hypothetical protein RU08_15565 [Pseudomonas fulva]